MLAASHCSASSPVELTHPQEAGRAQQVGQAAVVWLLQEAEGHMPAVGSSVGEEGVAEGL